MVSMNYLLEPPRYVYFLQCPLNGLIKIGQTENPKKRIAHIQISSPVILTPLGIVTGHMSFEGRIHEMFDDLRQHGEWFLPGKRLLYFIRRWTHPIESLDLPEPSYPGTETPEKELALIRSGWKRPRLMALWAAKRITRNKEEEIDPVTVSTVGQLRRLLAASDLPDDAPIR
jgi:hypothetical protein